LQQAAPHAVRHAVAALPLQLILRIVSLARHYILRHFRWLNASCESAQA
jgi:hypothetical protein